MDKIDIEKKALLLDRWSVIQVVSDLTRYRAACQRILQNIGDTGSHYVINQDALNEFEAEVKEIESNDLREGCD